MNLYLVINGHKPGLYQTWKECHEQIAAYPNPIFRLVHSQEEMDQCLQSWHDIVSSSKRDADVIFERNGDGRIQIYTDGSCFGNGTTKPAAGLGVYFGPNHPKNLSLPCVNRNTNNGAELEAILQAIEIIIELNLIKIDIHTDSEFLCNSLNLWYDDWEGRNWLTSTGKPVTYKNEMIHIKQLMKTRDIRILHVPSHQGVFGNEQADQLAREGARRSSAIHQGSSHRNQSSIN
ncbi:ribonuclease H1-like [Microplitis mediator]|uniref:ribonuclease H1-like n=1 Tax=Microplitis mediator TaxID=375433 RepID=UPI00255261ED|nr:ribonuclease H1-like [Microplitis mediator]XP_057328827.1 ribonuclease H1-like [Microplitis mediator]XP_057336472.1 ribonuclease H1-like [Microplitis mediator]XP_057339479.1 ribonuclease H1-like [Microplitis mediator]